MAYPPKIEHLSYNWSTSRGGHRIEAIIAHGTVGTDSRAYLSRGGDLPDGSDRKVSIHVLIQKPGDPIYRYVPDDIGANHAGYGTMPAGFSQVNPNLITVGFELENLQDGKDPYPDTQLLAMGWQCNDWRAKHGPLPILRHADIDPSRRSDTVGLSVAQIEDWCKKAAAQSNPLKARTIPGPPSERAYYCSVDTYDFYQARGGFAVLGYALGDEYETTGANNQKARVLWCERGDVKDGRELALLIEVGAKRWHR